MWEDPWTKPCYLFALVAGQLVSRDDTFTTMSGRKVVLRIWTPPQDIPKTDHAMKSLINSMKWDEEVRFFNIFPNLGRMHSTSVPSLHSWVEFLSNRICRGEYVVLTGINIHMLVLDQ